MENSKISAAEAISIVFGIFVTYTLVALPKSMLESTKTATLINIIYVGIIALFITFLIYKLLIKFPGDDIVGFITRGKGVKVHRINCPNIVHEKRRLIETTWNEVLDLTYYPVNLEIEFDKIPHHPDLKKISNYKDYIFWGGEDYELLFIINKDDYQKLDKNLFHKIGVVTENINTIPQVLIHYQNNTYDIINKEIYNKKVFNHFKGK